MQPMGGPKRDVRATKQAEKNSGSRHRLPAALLVAIVVSTVERRELSSRRWRPLAARRVMLAVLPALVLLLGAASSAQATSSFYWYGNGDSTCWQTGQLGSPSEKCSSVGPGYLPTPGHHTSGLEWMLNDTVDGIGEDVTLSPSGDYCSYYRLGDELKYQDSTNEGLTSGLTTSTPFSSYQEGDKESSAYNACQAQGTYWGQAVRGPSGNGCTETCGMHHYVSLKSQGESDQPWGGVFGEPSLVLSAEAGVATFTHTGTSYGGWGYVCPELEDTEESFHGVIEYCFQEWRSANNASEWKNERKGECGGHGTVMVNTYFSPGTIYATEMSGSANTFELASSGSGHFEAKITKTNLIKAVQLLNKECAGWHLSENPEKYALIGVEQGLEGWDGVSVMGGWGHNLELHTEYTPKASAGSDAVVSLRDEKTGRRWVFSRGSEGALWEWSEPSGTKSSWVHIRVTGVNEVAAGSGLSVMHEREAIWVTYTNASGDLEQVISDNDGASWSLSANFGTSSGSSIANVREPSNSGSHSEDMWVYYVNSSGALWQERWEGGKWINSQVTTEVAANSGLSVMHEREAIWVTYTNASGDLEQVISDNDGASWSLSANFGTSSGSSIANVREPSNSGSHSEDMWVYYVNSSGALWQERWEGGKWINSQVTTEVAANSGLSVMHEREAIWVTYTNASGDLEQVISDNDGASWSLSANFGIATASGSAITNVREPNEAGNPSSEDMWVYYFSPSGMVWQSKWASSNWTNSELREPESAVAGKGNIAWARDETTGKQWGYYVGSNNAVWQWRYTGGEWINSQVTPEVAANSGLSVMHEREAIWVTYTNASGDLEQVISDNDGASWSLSANFGTSSGSSIANVREPSNSGSHSEDMWVYYVNSSGALWQERWEGGKWINSQVTTEVAANSGLSVMHEREAIWVTYTNASGDLEQVISDNDGASWSLSANFGTSSGSSIANVREPSNSGSHSEDMWVYYVNSSGALWQERWEGGKWINSQVTTEVAANSGLSVMHEREAIWVTYTNASGDLEQVISDNDGASWSLSANFGTSSGSSIANIREPNSEGDPNSENTWVYYLGASGGISQIKWNGIQWVSSNLATLLEAHEETSTVKTEGSSKVSSTEATLEAALSPGGEVTYYQFEYGTTTSYGNSAPVPAKEVAEGVHTVKVTQAITGLNPNTTYHYRLVTTADFKTIYGEDETFTTKASDYTQTVDSGNSLNAVSCIPSTTDCVVSDSKGNAFYATNVSTGASATWHSWSGPSGESPSQAVACPTTALCLLADGKGAAGGNLYYATSLGGAWTTAFEPGFGVDALSCASSSFCIDGQGEDGGYIRYSTNPGSTSWTPEAIAASVNMNGVACLSSSFCAAVDSAGNVHVATTTSQIESSSWTATDVDGSSVLHGVACTSTTSCLAVDGAGNVLKLAISEGKATATKQDIDASSDLTAIACSGGSTCATVDSSGNVFVTTNGGTSWSKEYTTSTESDQRLLCVHLALRCSGHNGQSHQLRPVTTRWWTHGACSSRALDGSQRTRDRRAGARAGWGFAADVLSVL